MNQDLMMEPKINVKNQNNELEVRLKDQQDDLPETFPEEIEKENLTCYQSCLQCIGECCGFFRTWLPFPCCFVEYPYKEIWQSTEGVMERFGRYVKTVNPGLQYMNPCTEIIKIVDKKVQIIDLTKQVLLTKDNISLSMDASVYYKIIDARKATYRVKNVRNAVEFLTYATLRYICGQYQLQDLLEKRADVTKAIFEHVEEHVGEWGIQIDQIFIKDIVLGPDLQQALSTAAKERRLAESKVISAKADVESAKLMREAADILSSKAAMQIRYLETIQHLSKSPNTKIVFLPSNVSKNDVGHQITQGLLS